MPDGIITYMINRDGRAARTVVPEDAHKWYEFVYYISCHGELTLKDEKYEIKPGRYTLIRPHTRHSERHDENGICLLYTSDAADEL